ACFWRNCWRAVHASWSVAESRRMLQVKMAKRRDGFALDAQFEVPTPGVVALFGRSGCGKTTAINIIAGLLAADSAYIELDGHVLTDTTAGIAIPPEQR